MKVEKLTYDHLLRIDLQEHQIGTDFKDDEYVKLLLESGESYAIIKDEKILFCGGFYRETEDRAMLWALLSKDVKNDMIGVHRIVKKNMLSCDYNRIYARVHVEFANGLRWAEALGMEFEGVERQYIKGNDFAIFSIIKGA